MIRGVHGLGSFPRVAFTVLICLLTLLMLFPFVIMLSTSLKSLQEIQSASFTLIPQKLMLSNYHLAMTKGNWPRYFLNSAVVTIVSVVISLVINSLAGYAFARIDFFGRDTLFFMALIGLMIPPQVTMVPVFISLKNFPLAGGNDILGHGGIGFINSYLGMILPYIAGSFGVFLCRQFYLNFPRALDDAAKIDGCSRLTTYLRIYLPLSRPILATLAVLKATQVWNEYTWPLIIVNEDAMFTVQLAITKFISEYRIDWHLLMAATTIISLPLVVLFLAAQRHFIEGIVTTGIKG